MRQLDIEERRRKILFAIIESYIEIAVPIGSRLISQRFKWDISPATVRGVMADLEEMDLIKQPHTSAGRVPTDKGYRFYVDYLLDKKRLTKEEETLIDKLIDEDYDDFDSLMQNASRAINMITNVTGVVLTPMLKRSIFKHIEFIPIDPSRVIVVLITSSGIVRSLTVDIQERLTKTDFFRMSEFLNQKLKGMSLGNIKNYLTRMLLEERDPFYTFLDKTMAILPIPALFNMDDRLYFEGASSLMEYPEFRDIKKASLFLKVLEDKKDIVNLFNEDMETEGVKVHIGSENRSEYIQGCSVVTCNYSIENRIIGVLGAIGPTRMEYGKVISAVDYLSAVLGEALEKIG